MKKAFRHGEICFEVVSSIPKGLDKSDAKEFLRGSHGNPHMFDKGELYLKKENDFIFGYFKASDTTLFHKDHGDTNDELKKAKLQDGIYRLRRQVEFINSELKQVID